jgi:hypothetical protein
MRKSIERINSVRPWFEKQDRFLHAERRHIWQMAASQSGKTEIATPKFLRKILATQKMLRKVHGRYIDRPYWIVVPNSQIAAPVKAKVNKYLPRSSALIDRDAQGVSKAFWRGQSGNMGTAYLQYGASITYKSFEQGEGLVAESLGGAWIDECARCDDETIWQNIFARLKETKGWTIGTSSPAAKNAFYTAIYKKYVDDDDHLWLKWTSYDSAHSKHSAITLKEVEKARATMSPYLFAREYLADWASAEGLVYDRFTHENNVIETIPFSHEPQFIIGLDFGSSHPTAFEVIRYDERGFIAVDEKSLKAPAPSDILKAAIELYFQYKPYKLYYDYATGGANFAIEWEKTWTAVYERRNEDQRHIAEMVYRIWREVKGNLADSELTREVFDSEMSKLAPKAKLCADPAYKNVDYGIRLCQSGIAAGTIRFHSSCKAILDEIDSYVWKDHLHKDEPVKEKDDHLDAFRYAIATFAAEHLSSTRSRNLFGVAA